MKRLAILLFLLSDAAFAGFAILQFTPPTRNVDGSVLTDLVAYKFYWGTEPGNYTQSVRVDDPSISSYTLNGLAPNTYYFAATAINSEGTESRFSNMAVKVVEDSVPGQLVTTDTRAYTQSLSRLGVVLNVYGTIPLGTECDETNAVKGFQDQELLHGIPVDLVTPTGFADPVYAFAKCE